MEPGQGTLDQLSAQTRNYKDGDLIWEEGGPGVEVSVVSQGVVEVFKTISGKKIVLDRVGPGEILGEAGLFSHQAGAPGARAVDPVRLTVFDGEVLRREFDKLPGYYRVILEAMSLRLNSVLGKMTLLAGQPELLEKVVRANTLEAPRFSLDSGEYDSDQKLVLTHPVNGVEIRVTLNGEKPEQTSSLYKSPLIIKKTVQVSARAFKKGWKPSRTATGRFDIVRVLEKPVFSVPPGAYSDRVLLEITSPSGPAEIRYTTDGSSPRPTSPLFDSPLEIDKSTKIAARAFKEGWKNSRTARAVYEITRPEPVAEAEPDTSTITLIEVNGEFLPAKDALSQPDKPDQPETAPPPPPMEGGSPGLPLVTDRKPDIFIVISQEEFQDGDEITAEAGYGPWLWVVLNGAVEVVRNIDRRQVPILRLGAGSYPGAVAAILKQNHLRTASLFSVGPTTLGVMDMNQVAADLKGVSAEIRLLLESLASRLTQVTDRVVEGRLKRYTPPAKLERAQPIISQGKPSRGLFKVVRGRAWLAQVGPGGKKNHLATFEKNDFFGSLPFPNLGHEPMSAAVFGSDKLETKLMDETALKAEYGRLSTTLKLILHNVAESVRVTTGLALELMKDK